MDHDITINVNLPSAGVSVAGDDQSGAMAGAGPAPMSLAQLHLGGSIAGESAPAPMQPDDLRTASAASADADNPPPPAEIETLTAAMTPDAPTPIAFGSLQSEASGPAPSADLLGVAADAGDAPTPMALKDLESQADDAKGGSKKK